MINKSDKKPSRGTTKSSSSNSSNSKTSFSKNETSRSKERTSPAKKSRNYKEYDKDTYHSKTNKSDSRTNDSKASDSKANNSRSRSNDTRTNDKFDSKKLDSKKTGTRENSNSKPKVSISSNSSTTSKKSEIVKSTEKRTIVKGSKVEDKEQLYRLNKFIADSGVASRRKADELIAEGHVKINGEVVTDMGTKVHKSDFVTVKGDPIKLYKNLIYIILNKPKNVICSANDELNRRTIFDIVKKQDRLFSVGRLDRNTTGVIILTNDGELANRLMHPKFQIERIYNATLDKELTFDHAKEIAHGVELEDGQTAPCSLFIYPEQKNKVMLNITEGKNREVRRIFEHFDYEVRKLDRKSYAGISSSGLKRGEYRHLDKNEVMLLKKLTNMI